MKKIKAKKVIETSLKINFFIFPLLWSLAFFFSMIESFTYSGFLPSTRFLLVWAVLSGVLSSIFSPQKRPVWHRILLFLNKFFFPFLLITALIIFFLEETHYPNYVFSAVHIQPGLFLWPCFLSGFLFFFGLKRFNKEWFLKKIFQEKKSTSGQSQFLYYKTFYLLFAILLLIFTILNSVTIITKFYQNELETKKEMEIQYALRKINISQWIEEQFPGMKEVVFWCDNQKFGTDLIVLDPKMIWYGYEGLMRVFMTNCNITTPKTDNLPADEILPFLKNNKDSFWIASVSRCDLSVEASTIRENEDKVLFFKEINNDIICNSKEVLPGLYRFPRGD